MQQYLVVGKISEMIWVSPGTACPEYTDFSTTFKAKTDGAAMKKAHEIENLCYGARLFRIKPTLVGVIKE